MGSRVGLPSLDPASLAPTYVRSPLGQVEVRRSFMRIVLPSGNNNATYPFRLRPREAARRVVRVRNVGANSVTLAYGTGDNANFNMPGGSVATLAPGQEFIDTSGNPSPLFVYPTTATNAYAVNVYTETGVA